jgi:tripartite ATP-independent transporter DctM subunit
VASYFFGGISGSAAADTASLGSILIPMMVDQGYDADFSTAVTITSSCEGLLVPPSHNMVIYATTAGSLSVGALFLAGYIPGALLAASLMVGSYIISKKRNYPAGVRMSFKAFLKATVIAAPALFTVILLLGGIYSGVCTPTEAGALASTWALLISFLVYRSMGLKKLIYVIKKTAANTATLALLTGTSLLFSYIISREQVAIQIANWVVGLTDNKYLFLLVINVVFLFLGCVMDVSTIQYVFVPMVLPLVKMFNIDLVHFGVVICLNMMIGLSTPPFGMVLFIVTGIGKTQMSKVIKEILPMVIIMILLLLLCTYVPQIIMFIPNTMGVG